MITLLGREARRLARSSLTQGSSSETARRMARMSALYWPSLAVEGETFVYLCVRVETDWLSTERKMFWDMLGGRLDQRYCLLVSMEYHHIWTQ